MRKQPLFSFGVKIIQDTSKTRGYYGGRGREQQSLTGQL